MKRGLAALVKQRTIGDHEIGLIRLRVKRTIN